MSNWTTRLPHAHRYITKTLFEGAEADLNPPEEITFMDRPVYATCSTTVHLERIKRYYYEVSVPLGVQRSNSYEWLAIGYTGPTAAILYAKDGDIFMNSSRDPVHAAIPYSTGDIVGCGYEFPSRFFFTKNGIYLGHCIAHLGSNTLLPEARTWDMDLGFQQPINLGQRPFMFDIEGHFDKRCARLRRLTASLPLEILENILQFALVTQYINHLLHFSRVCHRWHTLMFRSVIDLFIVTRKDLGDLLKILKTRTPILARSVTTQESPNETWLHLFLASPLPLIKSTSTLAIQTLIQHQRPPNMAPSVQRQRFLEKAPSFLSQSVPGLLRRTFTEVHTLELSRYSFPTWTRFAQVVFALQSLENLACSSVTWDTSPTTPPTWLTFSKRLRHASFEDMGDKCIAGLFWLFLAGRPRQPSDGLVLIPSDISIIGELASSILWPKFTLRLVYEQKQGHTRSCTLSSIDQRQPPTAYNLSFEFEGNGVTYQLMRLHARLPREEHRRRDNIILQELERRSAALSRANLCRFCFELSDLGSTSHEGIIQRRRIAKAMLRQHCSGLLECTWKGDIIEDTEGVQWLKTDIIGSVTFGVEKTYRRGDFGQITWDVDALGHHFCVDTIPWFKLYKHDDQNHDVRFIADVAFNVSVRSGRAEFLLSDSVALGRYFLAVGDYSYCTESFEIIP